VSAPSESPKMSRLRIVLWIAVAVALFVLGALSVSGFSFLDKQGVAAALKPGAPLGGAFRLTDASGGPVTEAVFREKPSVTLFGYTHCPDVCPTGLSEMAKWAEELGPEADKLRFVFVTVDPERDTPDVMDAYVKALDARIIGMTGTPAEIAAAAKGYKVHYAKVQSQDNKQDYAMEHSSFVYLIGPDGGYVTLFTPGAGQAPDNMAPKLRELIGQSRAEKSAR